LEGREALEFADWYEGYPHKIGKAAARKAFSSARRKADLKTLIEGRDQYIREKPPDRPWCNPATWLNQERWADEPDKSNPRQEPRHGQRSISDQFSDAFKRVDSYIDAME
jgi:hypothetical protein